jgi:two-component system KDP operon response regulator KdpE
LQSPDASPKIVAMLKILVIDDEPQNRKFLRISLTASGNKVVEAETGGQGAEAAKVERPDLVILDLGLADLDGQEVISLIRESMSISSARNWKPTPAARR